MLLELNIERSLRTTTKRRKMIYFGYDIRPMNSSTMKEIVQGVTKKKKRKRSTEKTPMFETSLCGQVLIQTSSTEHPRSEKDGARS